MRILYQQSAPEEPSKITEKISEKGIPYELRNGGTTIYAPKQHIYQLRLDMAKEGTTVGGQGGHSKDLKSESGTLIDSEGRLLSGESDQAMANGAGTVHAYKERVEDNLEKKVEGMLAAVLGPGRAAVNIWATIDMNSTNTVTEKYEPKGVVTKEEIQTGSEGGPVGASASGGTASPGKTKKDETITTEYEGGKTVKIGRAHV